MPESVTLDDVRAARSRLIPGFRRTPLLESRSLSEMTGARVWLKAENLQHTGSFKVRGASNKLAGLTAGERARGVIAASAGNHAQGVAVAAHAHGVTATIVMPRSTPLAKIEATRGYGATVVLHGDSYDDARAEAQRLADSRNLVTISAFDDPLIVAGQGTLGLEIIEDLPDVDVVLVPVGGGGLAAGVAVALKSINSRVGVIGVQVRAAPGVAESLAAGAIRSVATQPTIAEGVAVGGPGRVTFPLLRDYLDDIVLVSDSDVAQAMVLLIERSKLVVEGAGATGVAALLSGQLQVAGKSAAVVLSGGNVDINMVARVIEHGLAEAGRYLSLTVGLEDKPGQLAALTALLAETGANVLSVSHDRFGIEVAVGKVHVELLLEVRDRAHAGELEATLSAHGFVRGEQGEPRFVPAAWRRTSA